MNPTAESSTVVRTFAVGPETLPDGSAHFRVWAPKRKQVDVMVIEKDRHQIAATLDREDGGYFSGSVPDLRKGQLYKLRLDGAEAYPDPASHFQPDGPHGPSMVVDRDFPWTDTEWPGIGIRGQVLYEMHIGTFTPEGTYAAAMEKFAALKELGITVLEMMPLACFPGKFGWGYDGVDLFAPYQCYGTPDDLRSFVNAAHAIGLGVILDVVYNHLGPDGNYLTQFSDDYFSDRATEWGDAINFDGRNSGPVREFFTSNVEYWIREYHFDGLRFDATQSIFDSSRDHILAEMARRARAAAGKREIILVAENEPQESKIARPQACGGYGFDALWNDDYHHSATVALTGNRAAYYTDHLGTPQEFVSAIKYGYLFQGQRYSWQKQRRGTPALGMEPTAFVSFIENHDQVANSGRSKRMHQLTSPGRHRALTALTLLGPGTPMLFQGQEFASSKPFTFFADHNPELAKLVHKGRVEFLSQFPGLKMPAMCDEIPNPADPATAEQCKLDWREWDRNGDVVALHRTLLHLRRTDPAFRMQEKGKVDGAVLGPHAFVLRYFVAHDQDRLLIVNLGADLHLAQAPEPLLAPLEGKLWRVIWSSEDPSFGGCGFVNPDTEENWKLPGESALCLAPSAKQSNNEDDFASART